MKCYVATMTTGTNYCYRYHISSILLSYTTYIYIYIYIYIHIYIYILIINIYIYIYIYIVDITAIYRNYDERVDIIIFSSTTIIILSFLTCERLEG